MNEFENNNQNENLSEFNNPPSYTPPIFTQPEYNQGFKKQKKEKKQKDKRKNHSTATVILSCILAAVIGAAVYPLTAYLIYGLNNDEGTTENITLIEKDDKDTDSSSNKGNSPSVNITVDENASSIAEAVAKKCTDSVVGIRTTTSVTDFFGGAQEQSGEGSGVIYTADGYIITNYHVIGDAAKIDVFLGDKNSDSYPAEVIGYNISCDLAVIKINAENLTPVELADSDKLRVGQSVITIGAPGGLEFMGSVTYGIISGLNRSVSADQQLELIQTDAAINPGNSGGALLNTKGELIGINSSKIAATEFEGMGFAIPSNAVKEKCDKIIARKSDDGVYLGVSISATYTGEVLTFYGYPRGAVVSSVVPDSPAYKAGIERGDIITKFNGVAISEYTVLNDTLYDCEPGQEVEATIYRDGQEYVTTVTLASVGS